MDIGTEFQNKLHVHGFVDNGRLEVVEDGVVVFGLLGLFHQTHELFLQNFPTDLNALDAQLGLGPLFQFDVHCRIESSWKFLRQKLFFIVTLNTIQVSLAICVGYVPDKFQNDKYFRP